MGVDCSLLGVFSSFCVSFSSLSGASSQCSSTPASRTCSGTRHLFCHAVGVSFVAPCVGSPTIMTGLGVCDQSCMSSVSQSMYLSKSPARGFDGWAPVCVYLTLWLPMGCWACWHCTGDGIEVAQVARWPWLNLHEQRRYIPHCYPPHAIHLWVIDQHMPFIPQHLGHPLVFACFVMEHQSDPQHPRT